MAIKKEDLKGLMDNIKNAEAFIVTTVDKDHNAGIRVYGNGQELLALTCAFLDSLSEKLDLSHLELLMLLSQIMTEDKTTKGGEE